MAVGRTTCRIHPPQWLDRLASVPPHVVWSQVRRRATVGGVVFNAVLSFIAILVALGVPKGAFFGTPAPWQLAIPWACWVRRRAGGCLWEPSPTEPLEPADVV